MEQNLNINNASVVKEADLPGLPISPVRRSHLIFTAIAALFLGIALALIREFIDSTIKTHDSLVAFGQPFLGIFPRIDSVDALERDLFVSNSSKSSAAECARTLRTNLLFMNQIHLQSLSRFRVPAHRKAKVQSQLLLRRPWLKVARRLY